MMDALLFLPESVVHALGRTLLHALWQGSLLAILVGLLRPRQSAAIARYRTAYGALLVQLLAGIATFYLVFEAPEAATAVERGRLVALGPEANLSSEMPASLSHSVSARLQAFYPLIVGLWLAGMAFFLIRLAGGLWLLNRIRRQGTIRKDGIWADRLQTLRDRVAFSRPVLVLESALVRTPMTLGFFKPLILVPVALVNQLHPEEAEAILAHELAHILRRDWLMNLIQALIESLFYYHPAIWWLSAIVRREREHCCDDYAVSLCGDRLRYARTLVRLQELGKTAPMPTLALGLTGAGVFRRRRALLLERIHRILEPQQQKLELMEKWIVSAMLMALLALWGIHAGKTPFTGTLQAGTLDWFAPEASQNGVSADSVPVPRARRIQKIVHDDGNLRVEMELDGDAVRRLVIEGEEIPAGDIGKYEHVTRPILEDLPPQAPAPPAPPHAPEAPARWEMRAPPPPPAPPVRISREQDGEGNTVIRLEQPGEPVEIIVKDGAVHINGKALETGASMDLPGFPGQILWNDTEGHVIELEEGRAFMIAEEMKHRAPQIEQEIRIMQLDRERMDQERRHMEIEMRRAEKDIEREYRRAREIARVEKEIVLREPRRIAFFQESNSLSDALRNQLLEDGLISDPEEYKLELSGKHLKVNGKKQPEGVHRRYLEIYARYNGKPMGNQDVIRIVEDDD